VEFEATAPEPTWRLPTLLGGLAIVAGIGLAVAGVLISGLTVLLGVGIGVALIGAGLVVFARRRRSAAFGDEREKQLADVQIDRRLRGRSQLENELKECQSDFDQQLHGISQPDLASAQAELAQEEAHVARIAELTAKLEGLVGRDAVETFPTSRDSALAAAANRTADLSRLAEEARTDGARPRLETEVTESEAGVETARQAAAAARAAVEANPVDAEKAAGEAERLAVWQAQLARLQRRVRVHEAALHGIERAEAATTALTTRYVERRINMAIGRMTGGRYRRVSIDDGTFAIRVFAVDRNDWVPIEALSDGTAEQLLIAARIGLLGFVTGGPQPPLLLDDPFAIYDDVRAARSFDLLRELAAGQQILYLTASNRFDSGGQAVVELSAPTAVDEAGGPPCGRRGARLAGRWRGQPSRRRSRPAGRLGHRRLQHRRVALLGWPGLRAADDRPRIRGDPVRPGRHRGPAGLAPVPAGPAARHPRRSAGHGRQRLLHPGDPGRSPGRGHDPVVALPGDDGGPGGAAPGRADRRQPPVRRGAGGRRHHPDRRRLTVRAS
jgi:hypothetical protein